MRFAYNTNGLQSHRLNDALDLLVDSGYDGVALTLDHMHLDPIHASAKDIVSVRQALRDRGLAVSVETGARYVLDSRRKHRPSLVEGDKKARAKRVDYLARCLHIAHELEAESLVFFSGINHDGLPEEQAWDVFLEALASFIGPANPGGVRLALEPEPGHLVASMADYRRCKEAIGGFGMALDVGHVPVTEPERCIAATIHEFKDELVAVHSEDSHGKVHEHLPFGQGCLDHGAILGALREVGFGGLVAVELSRHSHAAHDLVPASLGFLKGVLASLDA